MKILQLVTQRQYRGAELFAADLSAELIMLGHEVAFVGLYKRDEDVLTVEHADNRDLGNVKKGMFSFEITNRLIRLIKEINPDIIQCNGSDTLKYTFAASYFIKDIPIVYRNISIISEWVSNMPKKILYKKMFKKIAHVTSVGDEAMADFIKTYKYPENRTEVIRRGIPVKKVDRLQISADLRRSLGFNNKTKIAIHIGNFSPEKNHEFLLNVFSKIKEENSDIKLICVGSGFLYEKIKNNIHQRQLGDTIFLLGFRKDIPELLAASDCLVLSSKIEGVPGVILEAATQKTPSVSTNVGGVSEVLKNAQTGYLIDNFDCLEFKEKLSELMMNDEKRISFGKNAYSMISKGFDPKKNAKKFEMLYAELMNFHKRPKE